MKGNRQSYGWLSRNVTEPEQINHMAYDFNGLGMKKAPEEIALRSRLFGYRFRANR